MRESLPLPRIATVLYTKNMNVVNVCLTHVQPLPALMQHVDLLVTPEQAISGPRTAVVPDSLFGPNGSALSEYAQLIWLFRNIDDVAAGREFIRIFHYRRFVSQFRPKIGVPAVNQPWSVCIHPDELGHFDECFARDRGSEIFNTRFAFPAGVLGQYAESHLLEDLLSFACFLIQSEILAPASVAALLRRDVLIPACNIGVYRRQTFKKIFATLDRASHVLSSRFFTPRTGYQRRNAGYLLERLNSHLILEMVESGEAVSQFGYNVIVSEGADVKHDPFPMAAE
jgi:hypothetical protein